VLSEFHRLSPRVANEIEVLANAGCSFTVFHWARTDPAGIDSASSQVNQSVERRFIVHRAPRGTYYLAFFLPLLYIKIWKALRGQKFDVVHFTHILFLPLAVLWARTHGAKSVYDAYEFHVADFAMKRQYRLLGLPRLLEFVENRLVARVDGVLTIDSIAGTLEKRYRRYNKNVAVLYNVPRLDAEASETPENGQPSSAGAGQTIVYVGGLSRIKGGLRALESLNRVREEVPEVRLLMIGSFLDGSEDECRRYVAEHNLHDNVEFIEWLPYAEMFHYLKQAKLGLAPHQPMPRFWLVSRGNGRKFFTYMQASLPIVGPEFGEVGQVVREEGCGILCDTTDPRQIADAILYLLRNPKEAEEMGRRGRAAIEQKYNLGIEQRKLLEVYNRIGAKPLAQVA
jgi:glycosyltransferase involved in cell wall biosynthesis